MCTTFLLCSLRLSKEHSLKNDIRLKTCDKINISFLFHQFGFARSQSGTITERKSTMGINCLMFEESYRSNKSSSISIKHVTVQCWTNRDVVTDIWSKSTGSKWDVSPMHPNHYSKYIRMSGCFVVQGEHTSCH